jgi:hypothetical protein
MSTFRLFRTLLLAAVVLTIGCAAEDKPPASNPDAGPQPKLLSDLSAVSSAPIDPLGTNAVPEPGEGLLHETTAIGSGPRTYQAEPGYSWNIGTDANPAEASLLNDKAAKFATFSEAILDRVFAQLRLAEKTEEISRTKLPTDIKPVVVTAIMDRGGKLTELIVEEHSGKARIDQMLLEACKKGIWFTNPPVEALSGDGNYRLTISAKLENYASSDEHHWSFTTKVGLGLS